jgi:hypothetical protein
MPHTTDTHSQEEYTLHSTEALLAGTLALMTGHTQACCDAHRDAMAAKIVTHLSTLSADPLLSPEFQTLLWSLRVRWLNLIRPEMFETPSLAQHTAWHKSPQVMQ